MKFLSKLKLLFSPTDDEDATNKKYVDDSIQNKVQTTAHDVGNFTCVDNNGNITPTPFDSTKALYGKELPPLDNVVKNLNDADTLHGMAWNEFALASHTHNQKDVGLGELTNNKQVKAAEDKSITKNHVATWSQTGDGSLIRDSGFTIETSVPKDALFTDTTYNDVTDTESGLMTSEYKLKLDSINLDEHIKYFSSVEEMKNYDMSNYSFEYAYGVVGTDQYRWKASNDILTDTGKWRPVIDILGDIIKLNKFTLDNNGMLYVDLTQMDSQSGTNVTSTETLGKIALVPRGEFDESEVYNKLDLVINEGAIYICLVDGTSHTDTSDTSHWLQSSYKALNNYELYCLKTDDDSVMTYEEWAESVRGKDGTIITNVEKNEDSELLITVEGNNLTDEYGNHVSSITYNLDRIDGKSAYEIAQDNGFAGTEEEWLESLNGNASDVVGKADKLTTARQINGMLFDGTSNISDFSICKTDANISEKQIDISNFYLINGATISVMFEKGNTEKNITINVNNNIGLPVYDKNELFDASGMGINSILMLKYYNRNFYVCSSGGAIIDDTLSDTSENAIQNKVVKKEIDDLKKSVSDGKSLLADAITNKGVFTASNSDFNTLANNIAKLSDSRDASAIEEDILSGKTAYIATGKVDGTMVNVPAYDHSNYATIDGDTLHIGITKGAHIQLGASGMPEVVVPFNVVASALGITSNKIVSGNSICGVNGSIGKFNMASGDVNSYIYDYERNGDSETVKSSTIYTNLPFTPKTILVKVNAYLDSNSSTSSSFLGRGSSGLWVCSDDTAYDNWSGRNSDLGYNYFSFLITNINPSNFTLKCINYRSGDNTYKIVKIIKWIALG